MKTFVLTLTLAVLTGVAGYILGARNQSSQNNSNPNVKESPPTLQEFASFSTAIYQATGKGVIPLSKDEVADQDIISSIAKAIDETRTELNAPDSPLKGLARINEASRFFENLLLEKLNKERGITCQIPLNSKGSAQRSGYPDLHIIHEPSGKHYYLDPKLYENKSEASTLRTFYYSPTSKHGKIHHDAVHLLLGIKHDGNDGNWFIQGWKLIDLSSLSLKLKSEYNASNADLYKQGMVIRESTEKQLK